MCREDLLTIERPRYGKVGRGEGEMTEERGSERWTKRKKEGKSMTNQLDVRNMLILAVKSRYQTKVSTHITELASHVMFTLQ